jgi:hypothetical protein
MGRVAWTAVAVAVVACGNPPAATRTDLRAYLARSKSWAPAEAEANRTIDRILKTQFVDEAEVRRQIADSRPRVVAHLTSLRAYTPHSAEVTHVHAEYIAAWEKLLAGYDDIDEGFSSGDYTKLARGRQAMEAWRRAIVDVAAELRELVQHFGIESSGTVESRMRPGEPQLSTHSTKSSARPAAIA